jgi:hypothetical protein
MDKFDVTFTLRVSTPCVKLKPEKDNRPVAYQSFSGGGNYFAAMLTVSEKTKAVWEWG